MLQRVKLPRRIQSLRKMEINYNCSPPVLQNSLQMCQMTVTVKRNVEDGGGKYLIPLSASALFVALVTRTTDVSREFISAELFIIANYWI